MRTASRWVGAFGAVVCVAASVVMCVATFLPYTGGNWGDGLLTGNEAASTVTMSIIGGSDAWFVLGTVVILGGVATCHLAGVRRQATGFIALAASLLSLGLALKLPGTWKQDGMVYGEPFLLFSGFYVFRRRGDGSLRRTARVRCWIRRFATEGEDADVPVPVLIPERQGTMVTGGIVSAMLAIFSAQLGSLA
jgi:hypothetical protein